MMEKEFTVWIYSRVTNRREEPILSFQYELLYKFAKEHNYLVLGKTRDVGKGMSMHESIIQPIIDAICNEFIDAVLVYSKDRILCNKDAYTEFELLCIMHNVSIICYDLH